MVENRVLIYSKNIIIFWDDMDAYGHVNNAKYFTYMQECRFDWLKAVGVVVDTAQCGPILAATSCKFVRPITYPAQITVEMYAAGKVGKKTFFEHVIRDSVNPELVYALGEAITVWFDFTTNRSVLEPEQYRHLLPDLKQD